MKTTGQLSSFGRMQQESHVSSKSSNSPIKRQRTQLSERSTGHFGHKRANLNMNSNKILNIEMSKSRSPSGARPDTSDDSDKLINVKTINLLESSTELSAANQSASNIQVYSKAKDYAAFFRPINGSKVGQMKKATSGTLKLQPSSPLS